MFGWIRRLLPVSKEEKRRRFLEENDAFNAQLYGGPPTVTRQFLGNLKLRSGTLILGDPRNLPEVEVPDVPSADVGISARLRRYPSGMERIMSLTMTLNDDTTAGSRRQIGEVDIGSTKLVAIDKADFEEHWTNEGNDRIGVISTALDDAVLPLLANHFKLKTVRVNADRAEVVGPISVELEHEIMVFLKINAKYRDSPADYFRVATNSSLDRACHLERAWGFIPVGDEGGPKMFVCATGRGDGFYDVHCTYSGEMPSILSIEFIEEHESATGRS